SARNLGKNLWITSTGAPGGIKYSELPRDENGCVYDDWSFGGLINASSAMVDINLGASYIGMWVLVNQARKCFELEYRYHMILADDEEGYPTLGKELLILNTYGYTTTLSATFDNDAEIYYCESSEEGSMSERYDLTNYIKNQMAAVVGKNTDGTWGIAILNKTDSETRKRQAAALKENMKPHGLVSPSVTLEVELDITALHGTGVKTFSVQATGKNGMYLQPREDITLVDGKGTICVDPFEIISIRER
ncbi:MAG TPA: hypothetical protein DEP23_14130, partial [Ruminococcaceae bacterium]|nr:hypothetical protein [Oscillospiraceae bacterium]